MARSFFRKAKLFLIIFLVIAGSWGIQRWAYSSDVIQIDGKKVSMIDGDSFKVGEAEYRIYGIDAPEYFQNCKDENGADWPCGKMARTGLKSALADDQFSCEVRAKDQFGRFIVTCYNDRELDLGSLLVEQGYAVSGHSFDEKIYAVDEIAAKKAKRGIWRGSFVRPDIWRNENPRK
ncbi:hypothetical protein MNBD_ALPHA04-1413 [hydrothermal vent metagenome]|uniref:TNase-like domain-containing protein n=1 Tax=hydrothermal vent metagenome TaxID=652676 RepID=A0A3B0S148_9ZZZZ